MSSCDANPLTLVVYCLDLKSLRRCFRRLNVPTAVRERFLNRADPLLYLEENHSEKNDTSFVDEGMHILGANVRNSLGPKILEAAILLESRGWPDVVCLCEVGAP